MAADPIHQFAIKRILSVGTVGGQEIFLTNSALFMGIAVAGISLLMIGATASRALVPGRTQSLAEMSYEFVADMIRSTAGPDGMRFFPFVFSLFMFILFLNMLGMVPLAGFTVTSHIIITAALALRYSSPSSSTGWHTTACASSSCSCRVASRSTSCR